MPLEAHVRWQKRVYAKTHRISVQEILWDGKPVPKWPEVAWQWGFLPFPVAGEVCLGVPVAFSRLLLQEIAEEEFHTPQISMQTLDSAVQMPVA